MQDEEMQHGPQEAPASPLPGSEEPAPAERKRRITSKQLMYLALIALVLTLGLWLALRPSLVGSNGQYPSESESGIIYRVTDYQKTTPVTPGQAYLTVEAQARITQGDSNNFWMYTFVLREDNGIAFHIDRYENIWFKKSSAQAFVFSANDLAAAGCEADIPAHGSVSFDGGFPQDQTNVTGVGMKVEGHDENGAVLSFTAYIPFPAEQ